VEFNVYTEKHVILLFLKACPEWKQALEKSGVEQHQLKASPYLQLGVLAKLLEDKQRQGVTDEFPKIFKTIELIIQEGDANAKELVVAGFIIDLINICKIHSLDVQVFKKWLGEETLKAWTDIETWEQGL
jgi:hypothetical protein